MGTRTPSGLELVNPGELPAALASKTEFTQKEWLDFGISGLEPNNYVKSGSSYFKPVATQIFDADTEHALYVSTPCTTGSFCCLSLRAPCSYCVILQLWIECGIGC